MPEKSYLRGIFAAIMRVIDRYTFYDEFDHCSVLKNRLEYARYISTILGIVALFAFFAAWDSTHRIVSSGYAIPEDGFPLPVVQMCFDMNTYNVTALRAELTFQPADPGGKLLCRADWAEGQAAPTSTCTVYSAQLAVVPGRAACLTVNADNGLRVADNGLLNLLVIAAAIPNRTVAPIPTVEVFTSEQPYSYGDPKAIYSNQFFLSSSSISQLAIQSKQILTDVNGRERITYPGIMVSMPVDQLERSAICDQYGIASDACARTQVVSFTLRAVGAPVVVIQDETDAGLAKRIFTDISSTIGVVMLVFIVFYQTFLTRLMFTQKNAFIPHSLRESILYLIQEYANLYMDSRVSARHGSTATLNSSVSGVE